ncbi:hypothetical protein ACIHCQ_15095 [Streptomyces sp. NPDC052236]|uniref:hypothetical protein n=1 Tax=Streptomyces sp. NPDC052236 TaxID=3365686 RepID=UPI0037CEB084
MTMPADYARAFEAVRNGSAGQEPSTPTGPWPLSANGRALSVPWVLRDGALAEIVNVWQRALGSRDYASLSTQRFWRAQIPLAAPRPPVQFASPQGRTAVTGAALCHPLGNSVAVTVIVKGDYGVDELTARVAEIDQKARFGLADDHTAETYSLRTLGPELLRRLNAHRVRETPDAEEQEGEPLVIVSVVQANPDSTDEECRASEGSGVHHLLHALATRTHLAECPMPRHLGSHSLPGRTHQGGGVHYRLDRARVVWAPYRFRRSDRSRWLGCYHQNLALASMLTDSWLGVIAWAADTISNGPLPPGGFEVTERCAMLLGLVYEENARPAPVYRTRSTAAQIVDSGLVPALQDVRGYVGALKKLKPALLTPG